jgi:2-polyprenyl-3-methyl-5-hydroxy-6-metoxy-1,4-benzoquinol methylase
VLREAEIRPDELMAEQSTRYARDVAWLVSQRHRFVSARCPACDGDEGQVEWRKYSLEYRRCATCATVFLDPRPDQELLHEYYSRSENYEYWNRVLFPASEEARRLRIFAPRAARVADIAERHDASRDVLLDVGAGFGTFSEEIGRTGAFKRVLALEPEPHLATTCRSKGLEVIEQPVEHADFAAEHIDVITSFEVLEHLFSPRSFLEQCAAVLRPGGLLIVTCPNVRGFDIVVLGALSSAVDTEHLNYFHPQSLSDLLAQTGFEVLESATPGELDAELVRKRALAGGIDLTGHPFLHQLLIEEWDRHGAAFQRFLQASGLSSNMWLVARRS